MKNKECIVPDPRHPFFWLWYLADWTGFLFATAGLLTVGTMSFTNFQIDSDFKWLLVIPSVLWTIGLVFAAAVSRSD